MWDKSAEKVMFSYLTLTSVTTAEWAKKTKRLSEKIKQNLLPFTIEK